MDALTSPQDIARTLGIPRPDYRWHIAMVQSGSERQVSEALRMRRYPVYWPNYGISRRIRGKLRHFTRSVFPGYLFVLPGRSGWEPLRESPGVFGLMTVMAPDGQRFATLADDDPDFRRIEAAEAKMRENPRKNFGYHLGQRVKVTKGAFIELWGSIEALDDKGRVDVLIELVNRKVNASIDQLNPA